MRFLLLLTFLTTINLSQAESTFTYDDLTKIISEKNITTVESLIHNLPDSLKRNYTLMKKSGSLHEATAAEPRVILFGNTGELIITFNSGPDKRGGNAVEIMNYVNSRYELREIEFSSDGRSPPKISTTTPNQCMKCHGDPVKPIWGSYADDNGVYGESIRGLHPEEENDFLRFREKANSNPRYRELYFSKNNIYYPFAKSSLLKLNVLPNVRLTSLLLANYIKSISSKIQSDPFIYSLTFANNCSFPNNEESKNLVEKINQIIHERTKKNIINYDLDRNIFKSGKSFLFENETMYAPQDSLIFYPSNVREAMGLKIDDLNINFVRGQNKFNESGFYVNTKTMFLKSVLNELSQKNESLNDELERLGENNSRIEFFKPTFKDIDQKYIEYLDNSRTLFNYNRLSNICSALEPFMKKELQNITIDSVSSNLDVKKIQYTISYDGKKNSIKTNQNLRQSYIEIIKERCIDCHSIKTIKTASFIPFFDKKLMVEKLRDGKFLEEITYRLDYNTNYFDRMPYGRLPLNPSEKEVVLEYLKSLQK